VVATQTVGHLIAAAVEAEANAKRERAKAMDAIIDLLFERAEMRELMRQSVPYLMVSPATSDALSDKTMMPKEIAIRMERMLK
jgi:hypothetical protein